MSAGLTIALDAMGGDNAPDMVIKGAAAVAHLIAGEPQERGIAMHCS